MVEFHPNAMSKIPVDQKRFRNFAIFSTLAFTATSFLIVTLLPPFESTPANLTVAASFVIVYFLVLVMLGKRTYDLAVLITIILVLLCMLIPSLRRAKEHSEKTKRSLVTPP